MDIRTLVECLGCTLASDVDVRKSAEAKLETVQAAPGYGVALGNIVLAKEVVEGTRQLAAVLLKQYIERRWLEEGEHGVSVEDRTAIRGLLTQGLSDASSKIRTAAGMSIAKVAASDWPENWPNLLDILIDAIKERKDPNLVQGALRCLSLIAGDIDERQIPVVVPVLLPQLRMIAGLGGNDGEDLQRRATSIVHSILQSLGIMSGLYPNETQALIEPYIREWLELFQSILAAPITLENMNHWGAVMEAIKCSIQFLVLCPNLMAGYIQPLMSSSCNLLVACYPIFLNEVICQDLEDADYDSEGDGIDLQMLVSQVFELIVALVGNAKYADSFQSSVRDLMYLTIGYMQMTDSQMKTWMYDPNAYLAAESEELFTARVSGEVLLSAVIETYGAFGISVVVEAVNRHMQEALVAKDQRKSDWWKSREAAITCMGHICESFTNGDGDENQPPIQISQFLDELHRVDVAAQDSPYLAGRVLSIAGRMASYLSADQVESYISAAVSGLKGNSLPPVIIGSCNVIEKLVPVQPYAQLKIYLPDIYGSLKNLMENSTEEVLSLAMDTLLAVIKVDHDLVPQYEPYFSPLVLKIWSENMNDPLFAPSAVAVIDAISNNDGCIASICRTMLPVLSSALSSHATQEASVVERSLELLTLLLKPWHVEIAQTVYLSVGPALVDLLTTSDDPGILQNGTQMLRSLVIVAGEKLLTWGGTDPQATLNAILHIVRRILSPDLGDASAVHVGQLVNCLIKSMPSAMAPCLPQLLEVLVMKLSTVSMAPVMVSLLLVFCRMVHINANELVDVLSTMQVTQNNGSTVSGLEVVMSVWTERGIEITGFYNNRLSVTALAILLNSGHAKLRDVQVKGTLISVDEGVRTRSRTKSNPDHWTMVPAPFKIFSVLIDILMIENEGGDDEFGDEVEDETRIHEWDKPLAFIDGRMESAGEYLSKCAESCPALDDEPHDPSDPIAQMDLPHFISEEIKNVANRNSDFFSLCTQNLNPAQLQIVQEICKA